MIFHRKEINMKSFKKTLLFRILKKSGVFRIKPLVLNVKDNWKWREQKKSFSKNKNENITIYIVRRKSKDAGLFSYFITTLGGIAYAEEHGMVPVVDFQNYPNQYILQKEIGKKNMWEFYFQQPGGISLEDALKSKNVVLGNGNVNYSFPPLSKDLFENKNGELNHWRAICKKYIFFNDAVIQRYEQGKAMFSGKKVLGVLCRGTDYVAVKPIGHPVQPNVEMVIEKAEAAMNKESFDAVYLVTEDVQIVAAFKEKYGDKLLLSQQEYIDYDYEKKGFLVFYEENKQDKYNRGMDYLIAVLLLKECKGLITTITSGSVGIMCLADDFDYLYVFDLGYYQ